MEIVMFNESFLGALTQVIGLSTLVIGGGFAGLYALSFLQKK